MRTILNLLIGAAVVASTVPALATPIGAGQIILNQSLGGVSAGELVQINSRRHLRRSPEVDGQIYGSEPYTPRTFGGYEVNRYGFGNYVGGPAGFGGYPAGSGADFVYRQQQNQKCEYAPETC